MSMTLKYLRKQSFDKYTGKSSQKCSLFYTIQFQRAINCQHKDLAVADWKNILGDVILSTTDGSSSPTKQWANLLAPAQMGAQVWHNFYVRSPNRLTLGATWPVWNGRSISSKSSVTRAQTCLLPGHQSMSNVLPWSNTMGKCKCSLVLAYLFCAKSNPMDWVDWWVCRAFCWVPRIPLEVNTITIDVLMGLLGMAAQMLSTPGNRCLGPATSSLAVSPDKPAQGLRLSKVEPSLPDGADREAACVLGSTGPPTWLHVRPLSSPELPLDSIVPDLASIEGAAQAWWKSWACQQHLPSMHGCTWSEGFWSSFSRQWVWRAGRSGGNGLRLESLLLLCRGGSAKKESLPLRCRVGLCIMSSLKGPKWVSSTTGWGALLGPAIQTRYHIKLQH